MLNMFCFPIFWPITIFSVMSGPITIDDPGYGCFSPSSEEPGRQESVHMEVSNGFQSVGVLPKWLVYFMENPSINICKWMTTGGTPSSGQQHMRQIHRRRIPKKVEEQTSDSIWALILGWKPIEIP